MNKAIKTKIHDLFVSQFKKEPSLYVMSPSRINIIGEHIDYLGGNVFPANINLYTYSAFAKSDVIEAYSANFPALNIKKVELKDNYEYDKELSFLNYVIGCYQILKKHGYKVGGFSLVIDSEIPTASGLSSSASFGVMVLKGIAQLYGIDISPVEIAKLFKEVENNFMNLKNGIMDQFIIANGKKDHLMLLNTSTLEFENFPIELGDYNFLVINSKKPRNLIESKYNDRVAETNEALSIINKKYNYKNLCSIPLSELDNVLALIDDEVIRRRTKYAIQEQSRVKDLIENLTNKNFKKCGEILNAAHNALKNDYEVSAEELDFVNEMGNKIDGVLGIRMTGAGFGGCLIALMHKDANDRFRKEIVEKYKEKFGYACEVYDVEVVNGTSCTE